MAYQLLLGLGVHVVFGQAALPAAAPSAPAAPASAPAPSGAPARFAVEDGRVVLVQGEGRTALAIPGPILAVELSGTTLYVARGTSGAAVYDVSEPSAPRLVREVSTAGSAIGFHVVDGQPWVVVSSRTALPLEEAPARAAGSGEPTGPASVRAPAPVQAPPYSGGRATPLSFAVTPVAPGTVEIAIGGEQRVRIGDRFVIVRSVEVGGRGASASAFKGEERVGIAEVVAVKDDGALAELGRAVVAQAGDRARRAKADEEPDVAFPPAVVDTGEASVVVRPLINAGTPLGVGVLADLEASYWGTAYFAGVRVHPLGLGSTEDGSVVSTAALLEGGYDAQALAVGLGFGVSWVNGDLDYMLRSSGSGAADSAPSAKAPTRTESQETHSAFTLSQVARLGTRDGLNLSLHNVLIFHENQDTGKTGFIYGGTTGRFAVPVGSRADFFLEGGGGFMGYWLVGAGVATWIVGNGAPGSWRLSVSAGAAGISGSREITETVVGAGTTDTYTYTTHDSTNVSGPMVSLGLARRFSF